MSSPFRSHTATEPWIPTVIKVEGTKLAMSPESAVVRVPGDEDVAYVVSPHPAVPLVAWCGSGGVTHLTLYNRMPWGSKPLRVRASGEGDKEYRLGAHEALSWTSSDWLEMVSGDVGWANDPLVKAVNADATDSDVTKNTGSANMEFYHPVAVGIANDRLSYEDALYLDAYWRKSCRRARHPVSAIGDYTPSFAESFGAYWNAQKNLPAFNLEWSENMYGLNPWDHQHLDGTELFEMHRFSRHPAYRHSLVILWRDADRLAYYLQKRANQDYGGAARVPGWFLRLSAQVLRSIAGLDMEPWASLREEVLKAVDFHLDTASIYTAKWPLTGVYGSVSPEFRDENGKVIPHQKPWQVAVWALGLLDVAGTLDGSKPEWAATARKEANLMLDWIEAEAWDGSRVAGNIGYRADGTVVKEWGALTGTSWWHLPALIDGGRKDGAMAQALFESVRDTNYAVNFAAPMLGMKT